MSDNVKITLVQTRNEKVICDVTASWYDMKDWEANKVVRDIVGGVNALSGEWDKALTGGVPARK